MVNVGFFKIWVAYEFGSVELWLVPTVCPAQQVGFPR